jgi:propionate CoA-transferase
MRAISPEAAASLVKSGSRVVTGGFGSCGHPDSLSKALRNRFLQTGEPKGLRLLFAAGSGDRAGRGLDQLALDGLVSEAVGGFWGLCPALGNLAKMGVIDAHNWPQGVISGLFSEIAARRPGVFTTVGLGTFVDPRNQGGVVGTNGCQPLVNRLDLNGKEYLFYPSLPIDIAFLRGTSTDQAGNIYFCEETSFMDALAQATAVHNSGGIVVVQVKRVVDRGSKPPSEVRIPGLLVDYVVFADDPDHPQTYGHRYEPSFVKGVPESFPRANGRPVDLARLIIADRASLELRGHPGAHVNLGIGIPALIGERAALLGLHDYTLTVESGLFGGLPAEGLSFGASSGRSAVVEQSALFDLYDGGGIDIAFLGFGEVDEAGNVNVSRLGERLQGSGGFINITQSASRIIFCGTMTTSGMAVSIENSTLRIVREGKTRKFVPSVSHLTFNSKVSAARSVTYVTERCVFDLLDGRLTLTEIAPGVSIDDIKSIADIDFSVSSSISGYKTLTRDNISKYESIAMN